MSQYFNPLTNEKKSYKELCDLYNSSIPRNLEVIMDDWHKLVYATRPTTANYQTVKTNEVPELIEGKYTITYSVENIAIETIRSKKNNELNSAFKKINSDATVMSSLGFSIDAGETANRDINGLITVMEATGLTSTQFCDANNEFHVVTLDDCKVMLLEIIQNAQALYQQKWAYRDAIASLKDVEELSNLTIEFTTLSFAEVEEEVVEE